MPWNAKKEDWDWKFNELNSQKVVYRSQVVSQGSNKSLAGVEGIKTCLAVT